LREVKDLWRKMGRWVDKERVIDRDREPAWYTERSPR
jgi:hypothetical protein